CPCRLSPPDDAHVHLTIAATITNSSNHPHNSPRPLESKSCRVRPCVARPGASYYSSYDPLRRPMTAAATMPATRLIEVALPLPLFQTFTYALPDASAESPAPGSRVVVPVRGTRTVGICLGPTDGAGVASPRELLDVPDVEPALSSSMLALCKWIAEYYVVPLGVVVRAALPALLTGAAAPRPAQRTQRILVLRRELPTLQERQQAFARAKRQRELFEVLEGMGGHAEVAHLTTQLGFSPAVVKALVARDFASIESTIVARDPFAARPRIAAAHHVPTDAQRSSIDAIVAAQPGDT